MEQPTRIIQVAPDILAAFFKFLQPVFLRLRKKALNRSVVSAEI
jgi:hypothetical protein